MNDITPPRGRIRSQPRAAVTTRRVAYRPIGSTSRLVINSVEYQSVAVAVELVESPLVLPEEEDLLNVDLDAAFTAKHLDITARSSDVPPQRISVEDSDKASFWDRIGFRGPKLWLGFRRMVLSGLAVIILSATGYVGVDTWLTNSQAKTALNQQANAAAPLSDKAGQSAEGSDTTPLPADALKNYQVASDLPRVLYISELGVAARILPMSVNPDGSMQAPVNIYDAGWYTGSTEPGNGGAVVIDGHSSSDHGALFGNLGKLKIGDTMQLEKGDGTRLTYEVVFTQTVPKGQVDMKQLLLPYGDALHGLNLITCEGQWVNSQDTLTNRTIIYTVQV